MLLRIFLSRRDWVYFDTRKGNGQEENDNLSSAQADFLRGGAVEAVEGAQEGLVVIQAIALHQLWDAQIGGLQLLV